MRIAPSADRRRTAQVALALLAVTVAATIVLLASQALGADATPAPAEVCAPGAMTITRDGPVVYDGVDCQPGAHVGGSSATTVVPSATVIRPMSGTSTTTSASESD